MSNGVLINITFSAHSPSLKGKTTLIQGVCNMDITIETDTGETPIVVVDRGTPRIEDSGVTILGPGTIVEAEIPITEP